MNVLFSFQNEGCIWIQCIPLGYSPILKLLWWFQPIKITRKDCKNLKGSQGTLQCGKTHIALWEGHMNHWERLYQAEEILWTSCYTCVLLTANWTIVHVCHKQLGPETAWWKRVVSVEGSSVNLLVEPPLWTSKLNIIPKNFHKKRSEQMLNIFSDFLGSVFSLNYM